MSWEEDTDEEKSEPEYPDNDFKNCVAFMVLSIVSSMQGSSDRESKSYDYSDSDNFSDDDEDWETAYKKLLQDSIRMSKISKKRALKLKEMETQNSSLTAQLEESQAKVSQLEDQHIILSNNLIAAGKESELLKQQELKAKSKMNNLKKELSDCKAKNEDLRGKLKMALTELNSATASIKRMNTGSKKLDEILGSQKTDKSKSGIGYTHGASSSKDKGKSVFVRGPTVY